MIAVGGEAGVSAAKIGKVMQIVSKNLFDVELQTSDVPSKRSCLRFLDAGHVLSNI